MDGKIQYWKDVNSTYNPPYKSSAINQILMDLQKLDKVNLIHWKQKSFGIAKSIFKMKSNEGGSTGHENTSQNVVLKQCGLRMRTQTSGETQ